MGFNKYSLTCDTELPSRESAVVSSPTRRIKECLFLVILTEYFRLRKISVNLVSQTIKVSSCMLMSICWTANEEAHLSGPLLGRLCSGDPLLSLVKSIIHDQTGPRSSAVTRRATALSRGCRGLLPLPVTAG